MDQKAYGATLRGELPYAELSPTPMPKSWYTIVGGHFEGVRFASYSVISAEISAYPSCRIFGTEAGVTDEASAYQLLRDVRKQRVRGEMEKEI
eukprot:6192567-Pleurochrysis_carterae.AAC.1